MRTRNLLPTADHIDPCLMDFEICSWLINMCKTHLNAGEFTGLCNAVVDFNKGKSA